MARDWKEIGSYVYEHANGTATDASSGNLGVTLYYDKNSLTTTSVDIKFVGSGGSNNGWNTASKNGGWTNGYCIVLSNPSINDYQLGVIKDSDAMTTVDPKDSYKSCVFTITKTASSTSFNIPFWICNFGNVKINIADKTVPYYYPYNSTTIYHYDVYEIFNGTASHNNRTPYKKAHSVYLSANVPTAISVGAITGYTTDNITQVTIGASKHGQNNSITSMTLRINGTVHTINWSGTQFTSSGSCNVTIPETAGKTYDLKVELAVVSTYEKISKSKTITATHYFSPRASLPMEPPELMAPYKDKLVINGSKSMSCTWAWEKYTINPVLEYDLAGYAVKLKFQPKELISSGESYQAYLYDSSGKQLSEDSDGIVYYLPLGAIDSENPSITFDPTKIEAESYSIKVGDRVQLGVAPYSVDNFNRPCPVTNNITWSGWIPVKRSAVTRVKTETGWQEGQVHIKTDAGWVEATAVLVKTETGWAEAI